MRKKHFDIVIVGGGVIGCAVAYYLSKIKKMSIALVDKKKPGNASRASAGGLWPIGESVGLGCGVIFFKTLSKQLSETPGLEISPQRPHQLPDFFFDFCLQSNAMFPGLWQELKENHGVDFKLEKTGLKFIIYDEHDQNYAQQIADSIPHLQHHLRWLDAEELRKEEPNITPEALGAFMFLQDDQVNPYLLLQSFQEAAQQNGVQFFLETEVQSIAREQGGTFVVKSNGDTFSSPILINAAGSWASQITQMVLGREIPVFPIKGQIVLSERLPKLLRSCLSTSDCYIAQKDNGEVLIGSTTEEKGYDTSCTYEKLQGLVEGAIKCIPRLQESHIKRTWAGLRPGTPDELPILGFVEGVKGYINACGHFRTGILTSALTGQIISELVEHGKASFDITPFSLSRFD